MPTLSAIFQYPVKGLNGISLDKTRLENRRGIPNDRRFAITRGLPSDYDGSWLPPGNFAVNAQVDHLQNYVLQLNMDGAIEIVAPNDKKLLFHPDQLAAAGENVPDSFVDAMELPPEQMNCRLIEHSGNQAATEGMWDYPEAEISIINLSTVQAIAAAAGRPIDPQRFRGNLLVDGIPAWQEYDWIGKIIDVGGAKLEVLRPINRCPATSVDPESGKRDFDMPSHLQQSVGHVYCGVYARVIGAGEVQTKSELSVHSDSPNRLEDTLNEAAPAYALWPRLASVEHRNDLGTSTLLTVGLDSPWKLLEAKQNQRARVQIPGKGWTGAPIERSDNGRWMLEIAQSATDDPLTEYLRTEVLVGEHLIVSGPYGGRR